MLFRIFKVGRLKKSDGYLTVIAVIFAGIITSCLLLEVCSYNERIKEINKITVHYHERNHSYRK